MVKQKKDDLKRTDHADTRLAKPNSQWLKASYYLHTFSYRDPRTPSSSAQGLPVVSPTAVLLGIASTLFNFGKAGEALEFLHKQQACNVVVDPPRGVIFFRAFQQLRRYHSTKKGKTERVGLTAINQATREYGLVDGVMTLYVGVPADLVDPVKFALTHREYIGTHDSLCSLVSEVAICTEPSFVTFMPPEEWQSRLPAEDGLTLITLARFKGKIVPAVRASWWLAGGQNTELVPYLIQGSFRGTSRGKIYRKNKQRSESIDVLL